jgi:hypothetical protein
MAITPINVQVGLTRVSAPLYASEPGYVSSINAQMKVIQNNLAKVLSAIEGATPEIMLEAVRPTFLKSQSYCPLDKGPLRASGYCEIRQWRGQPRVEVGYAKGGKPRYAVFVHEKVQDRHAPPTRAKFLEAALNEDLGAIRGRLEAGYRRVFGGS